MKKIILIIALVGGLGWTAMAQKSNHLYGGGISYGAQTEKLGLNLRAYKPLKNNFRVGAEFTLFARHTYEDSSITYRSYQSELMLNLHYLVKISPKFSLYPLVGINFNMELLKNDGVAGVETTTISILTVNNIGAGMQYQLNNRAYLFGEYRYATGEFNKNISTVGMMIHTAAKM